MHFNPRFDCGGDVNTIVFNSLSGGSWGDEHREGLFPFARGEECKVRVGERAFQTAELLLLNDKCSKIM